MLRIDETSKTLVTPEAAAFVPVPADREELQGLLAAGWSAFAAEIGEPHLQFLAAAVAPGVDVLAFDETAGRVAIACVAAGIEPALIAAATVSGWDARRLEAVHETLAAAVPGDSPRVVLVGPSFDDDALTTLDWLVRRHGVDVVAHRVQVLRFGSERMLEVTRAYPVPETAPEFVAGVAAAGQSAPPPRVAVA
jgi:hypothetical protein